ncbi:hypothetical protein K450DRAFT_274689 [Umbelopsis ramanniana AG]|uniref:Uncharacterized protein n=1 Tax=Umbelopsis ramanniana AG TaxID=1314678 RepID=A0AAD5HB44_UMBRA|nr:uncharacterized protein K450DRAFT_274689 [Umbelopsis ramanniana AG]KAI8576449.1 hypothetical protein K450DRAFT_274689 [Umbelopsis ramanniana AG]
MLFAGKFNKRCKSTGLTTFITEPGDINTNLARDVEAEDTAAHTEAVFDPKVASKSGSYKETVKSP